MKWFNYPQISTAALLLCMLLGLAACGAETRVGGDAALNEADDCNFRQVEQWIHDMSEDEWYGLWRFLTANVSDKEYYYLYNLGWEDYVQYITDILNGKI